MLSLRMIIAIFSSNNVAAYSAIIIITFIIRELSSYSRDLIVHDIDLDIIWSYIRLSLFLYYESTVLVVV